MTEGIRISLVVDEDVYAAGTYISFRDGGKEKTFQDSLRGVSGLMEILFCCG